MSSIDCDFKPIPGYSLYQVSTDGRAKGPRGILKTPLVNGYPQICAKSDSGDYKSLHVHRAVAMAFIPQDSERRGLTVNHKNGDKLDNRVENLEWCSLEDNVKHAWDTSLIRNGRTDAVMAKELKKKGMSARDIAKEMAIGLSTVYIHLRGSRYA